MGTPRSDNASGDEQPSHEHSVDLPTYTPILSPEVQHLPLPSSLLEIWGQADAAAALTRRLDHADGPNALLLVGPPRTGKYLSARLFAAMLNLPGGPAATVDWSDERSIATEKLHPDVVTLDCAARDIRSRLDDCLSKVGYGPIELRTKVLILRNADKLGNSASMLLKPIEEPAQGVLWILVARDAARLSASIVSRCITVEFRTPSDEVVVERLRQRAEAGGITVEEGGIEMLAQAAHGSVLLAVDDLAELADAFGKNVRLRHIRCLVDGIRTPFWIRTRNFVAASLVRKFPWAHRESQFELERGVPPLELVNRVLYLVHLIEIADRGGEDDLRAAMKAGRHYAQEARDVLDLVDGARSLLPQAHEDLMSDWRDECMKCLSLCGQMKNDYVMDYLWARLARRIDSIETRKKDGTREEAGAGGSDIGDL